MRLALRARTSSWPGVGVPLHTQAGDTTAVATSPLSLFSTPTPRKPQPKTTGPHHFRLDGRSPDTGLGGGSSAAIVNPDAACVLGDVRRGDGETLLAAHMNPAVEVNSAGGLEPETAAGATRPTFLVDGDCD